MKHSLDELIDLAKHVELGDAISWDGLNVDRDRTYQLIASQIYEQIDEWGDDREIIMLASIVKLLVENFVLNVKVQNLETGLDI
jgi:hypothetical protein